MSGPAPSSATDSQSARTSPSVRTPESASSLECCSPERTARERARAARVRRAAIDPRVQAARRGRRALFLWGIAMFAYIVTVAGRTSFGVASVQAAYRFSVGSAALSLFGMVQLGTYAAAQFPAGLLLDRFGARRMLVAGSALMLIGQIGMAFCTVFGLAVAARVLIGAGDAAVFISVIRLAAAWFPARRVPLITQLTGVLGQSGQVISAIPFFAILAHAGWAPAFSLLAALVLVAGLGCLLLVRDEPRDGLPTGAIPVLASSPTQVLKDVLASPGAWAGLAAHWITLFAVNTYVVMWGVPFLSSGHHLPMGQVSTLLTIQVLIGMTLGPVIGTLSGRFPLRRGRVLAVGVTLMAALWAVTLAVPGEHSVLALVPLACALALGAALSGLGFDIARTGVQPMSVGTAVGFVNIGGFGAGLVSVFLVGLVLDLLAPAGSPDLDDYRVAFASMGVLFVLGVVVLLIAAARGGLRPVPRERRPLTPAEEIGEEQAEARAGSGPAA
ncbi:MFS transporter [Brachybacterium kimchii]|uniref:MFS transporter n=1 Tax=Brachybacterium kimchii TaxID=2942909 RepID=A0ABY4N6G6_9MICO|nr:MFS transporter [Brachybacterium kimchii]UQN29033.1 MFS transporter [Brachybacterium kimchii]